MPLVVPEVSSGPDDKTGEWVKKLVGKKLSEDGGSNETIFCKRELPQESRVIKPGTMVTKDFNPNRLNVHVDDSGTVSHVYHG